jgi:flavin-dependent dehydrogenase
MPESRRCDVLIAGAGPAGLATALYLLRRRPSLAGRVVALERARHPRVKVCAGGLIPKTMQALAELGLELDVPAARVQNGIAVTEIGRVDYPSQETLCTVIRRHQFDAWLARHAVAAGLEIVEDCRVIDVQTGADGVRAITGHGEFEAPLLVGADGSGSRVREVVFGRARSSLGRAIMMDLPADSTCAEFADAAYRFDFRCVAQGIAGYSWSFPCLIDHRPHLNVGIYDQHPNGRVAPGKPKAELLKALAAAFPELPIRSDARSGYKAFPIRWYEPAQRFVSGSVMLAGDAAGVDPLMGEGISFAFEHGKLAAAAIDAWLGGASGALAGYDRALHYGSVARKLRRLRFAAARFYGPRHRLYFRLASLSRATQQIGVDWYNGVRDLDELPTAALARKWLQAVLIGAGLR